MVLATDFWSLWDAGDVVAVVVATLAFFGYFVTKRSIARTDAVSDSRVVTRAEQVDADVLGKFTELFDRITRLETDLAAARITIEQLRTDIGDMRKVEEFLEASLHERDKEISGLKKKLEAYRKRILHLEEVCKRAGINGDDPIPC